MSVHVLAPGRVNLIGDHTDYTGGLVMPMAIDRYTEIKGVRGGDRVHLTSADDPEPVDLPLDISEPQHVSPAWGKYIAGVVGEMRPTEGFRGHVTTDIPIGGGMSSSHALQVAMALALGGGALRHPLGVGAADQRAAGDELHDNLEIVGEKDGLYGQFAAVDHQRMPGHAGRDRQLVHDAGRHTRGLVLRALSELGEVVDRALEAERERHRDLQGVTARHAATDRDVGGDMTAEAFRGPHLADDAGDVLAPGG